MAITLKCWGECAGRLRGLAVFVTLVTALAVWPGGPAVIRASAASTGGARADTAQADTALSGTAQADTALASRLDAVLDNALAQQQIVGAVVVAARNGEVVYQRAVGMADREKGKAMSLETRFRLASMSKPIVSAAALALADQGMIGLDDPVTRWIPSFTPMFQGRVETEITLRQLLTHTAGLSYGFLEPADDPMALAEVSDGLDNPPITLEENIWRLASVPLYYEPGTGWRYSLAIDVLGEVVSRAGGDTLPAVVKKLVTGPLGMTATGFCGRQARHARRRLRVGRGQAPPYGRNRGCAPRQFGHALCAGPCAGRSGLSFRRRRHGGYGGGLPEISRSRAPGRWPGFEAANRQGHDRRPDMPRIFAKAERDGGQNQRSGGPGLGLWFWRRSAATP